MNETIEKLLNSYRENNSERAAFEKGFDCAINGPNKTNCHLSIFRDPKMTAAWEYGKSVGDKAKAK